VKAVYVKVPAGLPAALERGGDGRLFVRPNGCGNVLVGDERLQPDGPVLSDAGFPVVLIPLMAETQDSERAFADMAKKRPDAVMLVAQDGRVGMYADDLVDEKEVR